MTAPMPGRPADVPHDVPLRELLDAHQHHAGRLVDAAYGTGELLPAEQLARHAVAELATGAALADRVLAMRWVAVRDALTYGATLEQSAAAMGLDVDEVVVGLTSWADGQLRHRLMSAAEHARVLALVAGGAR